MARKDRVPNPPKRSQAPQRRSAAESPDGGNRRRALVLGWPPRLLHSAVRCSRSCLLTGRRRRRRTSAPRSSRRDAPCRAIPALANQADHGDVPTLETKPNWNSSPPTSGPHYGQNRRLGRLRRGGAARADGAQPRARRRDHPLWPRRLRRARWPRCVIGTRVLGDPNGLIISPLSTNKARITLSAWTAPETVSSSGAGELGWLASCPSFDADAFEAFIDEHRYKGPERLTPEQLEPGTSLTDAGVAELADAAD